MKLSVNLTVTQRIGAGFSFLVILMLLMSFFSYNGLSKLNDRMIDSKEQIVPMLVNSGSMGVSLLSVNRAVMQFLFAKDSAPLDEYEQSFTQQYQSYLVNRDLLQQLASNKYPAVITLLDEVSALAQNYLENSKEALSTHREFVEIFPIYQQSYQSLRQEITSLQAILDDLAAYGDDNQEMSAATTLSAQLAVVVESIEQLRNISSAQKMQEVTTKARDIFTAMIERNDKLSQSHADTATDIKNQLDKINQSLNGKMGVLLLADQQLMRTNDIQALVVELAAMINSASDKINEFC
jgi:CHASE3 domain sensor protein